MRFAVLDLETTGGSPKMEKITEVAVIIYEDGIVKEEWQTLVNPERSVPPFVSRMTGITDAMLADAPKFYEVAKQIVEITEKCILVAHNARFDYGFLQEEFKRLGYSYHRKRLCTVQLSKRLVPELTRHGLDSMINHFDIQCGKRHRAMDDTRATLELLKELLNLDKDFSTQKQLVNFGVASSKIPEAINMEDLHALPESCGVYFFEDADGRYLYIGKSLNIKKRVFQHFREINTKTQELQRHACRVTFETTGSELISLLHESALIKRYRPPLNKAQRKNRYPFAIVVRDTQPYIQLEVLHVNKAQKQNLRMLDTYGNRKQAINAMKKLQRSHELCPVLCGLEEDKKRACSSHGMGYCHGACAQIEGPDDYNERAELAISSVDNIFKEDFVIIEDGRYPEERSLIVVRGGYYVGFGYVPTDINIEKEELDDHISLVQGNAETNRILLNYLRGSLVKKVRI